jgi:hypothetical protein
MARRVRLDNVEHARLRVSGRSTNDLSINQALVVPNEFEQLQREYPILFRKDSDGSFQAVALLGLDRGENLFADEGVWNTSYAPATLRRGPFFFGVGDEEQRGSPAIVIDLDDPRVSEAEGEPFFLPHGGAAPCLQQAADALRIVHQGLELSRTMFSLFSELDLIRPIAIDVNIGDGKQYHLADFFTIDAERFGALSGSELERLNRAGFLAPAIHARSSLGNINRLIELKTDKLAGNA